MALSNMGPIWSVSSLDILMCKLAGEIFSWSILTSQTYCQVVERESLGLMPRYCITQTDEPSHPSSDSSAQVTRTGPKGSPSPVLLNLGDWSLSDSAISQHMNTVRRNLKMNLTKKIRMTATPARIMWCLPLFASRNMIVKDGYACWSTCLLGWSPSCFYVIYLLLCGLWYTSC